MLLTSRRQFLKTASSALALALFASPSDLVAALGEEKKPRHLLFGSGPRACLLNLESLTMEWAKIDSYPHSFLPDPSNPRRFLGIERGKYASVVDFDEKRVITQLTKPDTAMFYGHAVHYPKGNVFFIVRVNKENGQGHLVGYDAATFKEVSSYQVTVGGLHDCHMLTDGTLLVTSSGVDSIYRPTGPTHGPRREKSSLVHVDPSNGKVLNKMFIDDEEQLLSHFFVSKKGQILAVTTPKKGDLNDTGTLYTGNVYQGQLKPATWVSQTDLALAGEMLSIAVDTRHSVAAVTNPRGKKILFVDMRNGKLLAHADLEAQGIAFDPEQKQFLATGKKIFSLDERGKAKELLAYGPGAGLPNAHSLYI